MITVIADDITGAAEIAGIAKSAGLNTKLVMVGEALQNVSTVAYDVVVYATDTRQMSEAEAVKEVIGLVEQLPKEHLLFKKTDSVLRGHIKAECDAILSKTDYDNVLLIPQNPSKGRVVKNGLYYINNVLLSETQFAHDPEFPATSADVSRFGVPDAESIENITEIVKAAKPKTLFAGGADLFKAVLCNTKHITQNTKSSYKPHNLPTSLITSKPQNLKTSKPNNLIMVCGSTQSKSVIDSPLCKHFKTIESNMPEDVFFGRANAEIWYSELREVFPEHGVLLTINYPSHGGKDFAVRLRKTMAEVVRTLVNDAVKLNSDNSAKLKLIIEGGATAFETLATLGWTDFVVTKEHAPGVVEIKNSQASIVLKPGSYPWNGLLEKY